MNRYFADVAADSGKTTNVYYTATQYSGIRYQSTFAGTTTATDPLPASGCSYSACEGLPTTRSYKPRSRP